MVNRAAIEAEMWKRFRRKDENQNDEASSQQGASTPTAYERWNAFLMGDGANDNDVTRKVRSWLQPDKQAEFGNALGVKNRNLNNPYLNPSAHMIRNPYVPGSLQSDMYEAGRTGEASFKLLSGVEQLGNWDAFVRLGLNDANVAEVARQDAQLKLLNAHARGVEDAPRRYDSYIDRNAGKGYKAFGGNAGDVHKYGLSYENVLAAEATKLNRKEGRKDNEETLRAEDYASLSDKYIDDMIPQLEDHVTKLRAEEMIYLMNPSSVDHQAVKGELMTTQMLLDGLKQEKKDRAALVDLAAEYAQGNSAVDWASMVGVDEKGTDIVDKMLYMHLVQRQRENWDDDENEWYRQIAEEMGGSVPAYNDYSDEGYHLMTADEIALVNKVWNTTHDPIKTQEVLDAMASTLRSRRMNFDENLWAYRADAYGDLMVDLASIPMQGYANFEGAVNAFQGVLGNEDVKDVTSGEWRTQNSVNAIRGWTGDKAYNSGGWLGKIAHDWGLAAGDEALKFLPSLVFGPGTQQALSAVAGLSQGTYDAYERGVENPWLALAEGGTSAAIDALTENLGLDVPSTNATRPSKHLFKQIAAEAGEEMASEALGQIAGEAIADWTGTTSANDQAYMDALMASDEKDRLKRHQEAQEAVAGQNLQDIGYSGLMGGLVGATLSGPSAMSLGRHQRRTGKMISSNNNANALLNVAMSMNEGSEARQMAETFSAQAKKGKKMSNGQLGRLYAATAKDLDAQSAAVVTETMNDAIVEQMVDKGETEEVARRAAPILAKQLRGETLTKEDTKVLAQSEHGITMMEELNQYAQGGEEDGPKTGLFKRTAKGTQVTNEQIQEAENLLLEKGDSAKAAKRAAPLLARAVNGDTLTKAEQAELAQIPGGEETVAQLRDAETQRKELLKPTWVKDAESSQQAKEQQRATDIISKGQTLLKTTMPSSNTAIQKSAKKAKTLTVKSDAETGVRNTSATPLGSKESVDIQRVEAGEDGVLRLQVKNADGTEKSMSYQQLSFKSESMGHVITHAIDNAAGNAELANLMVQGYTGGDSTEYLAQFDAAYRAGYDNSAVNVQSMTSFSKGISKEAFKLGQKQAQEAEQTRLKNIGKGMTGNGSVTIPDGVDVNRLSKPQRRQVAVVRTIAKATGINFTFFQSTANDIGHYDAENGSYDAATNSIRLDLNAGKNYRDDVAEYAILRTAAHEMTHYIEANSRENYAKMRQYIADEFARKGIDFNTRVQEKIDRSPVPMTRGGAIAEVVADGCEMMLQDSQAVQRLLQKDESLAGQIKQVLSDFADRIRKAFDGIRPGSKDAEALLEERDGLLHYADELVKLWDEGLVEAVETVQGNALTESGIVVENKTAYANPQLSVRTWNASAYVQERDAMAKELAEKTGVSVGKATKWLDDVNSIASLVLSDPLRLDYISSEFGSSFKSNPEYGGSVDMSTLCPKRRLATGTLDAIQDRLGDVALTRDDFLRLRAMMAERGHEVACGLCFVESSRANLSKYNKQFIDLYNAIHPDQEPVTMGELNTIDGLENIRSERPDVYAEYEKFMNKLAQRKPKLFEKRTEYDGEILRKFRKDTSVETKNRNGGLRLQSFSDFEIVHLIDMMQVITDMANVGLAGQAYTKVTDFAWALGNTGLKINLSLIAKGVDENGKLIYNDIEGMNHVEAKKLRDAYSKNVGTILVTFTDEQLIAAMQDDFVDFIIPFHRSQWKKTDYRILGLPEGTKDYTLHQNEKLGRKRVKQNFMPNEYWDFTISGKENAQKYLNMCNAEGRIPKFAKFLQKNADGTYSLKDDGSTDGYWKLLIDFKMYDNDGNGSEQLPVQPNFNMEQAARMLNEYKGGHETLPVAWDVVDDFVAEYQRKMGNVQYSPRNSKDPEVASIKDQIRQAQAELNSMAPVASVMAPDMTGWNKKKQKTWVLDNLKYTGYKVDVMDFGVIEFGANQIDMSLEYLNTDAEVSAFLAVPRVLKRGKLIARHEDHKVRGFGTVTFAAPVEINGERGNMAIVVKRLGRNLYKTHRILMPDGSAFTFIDNKKAEPTPAGGIPSNSMAQAQRISSTGDSITRGDEFVNKNSQNPSAPPHPPRPAITSFPCPTPT